MPVMKHLLLTTIAAVVVVGCGGPPKYIWEAAEQGDIEAVKEYLAIATNVIVKDDGLSFPRGPVFFSPTSTTIIAALSSCGSGFT
jgi:hypothetical protein